MALEVRLLSFSTGKPHPLAEQPTIFLAAAESRLLGQCDVVIEIAGDLLALLIIFPEAWDEKEGMFFLVWWKRGKAYSMSLPVPHDPESWRVDPYFAFVSQDTLVFPNSIQNMLTVTKIVIDSDDTPRLVPLCVLHLPPLARRAKVTSLSCHGESNPTGSGPLAIPVPSNRPFRDKAEDAIMMFTLFIHAHLIDRKYPFTFIAHRHALFAHIPAAHRACAPFCSPPVPMPALAQVPWSAWGPATTRWFQTMPWGSLNLRTAGQRAVALDYTMQTPITLRDFNPYAVRTARALATASGQSQQGNWSKQLPNGNSMSLKVEDTVIAARSIFKEDVRSSLPYIEIVPKTEYEYDDILIDEERILGLKVRLGCLNNVNLVNLVVLNFHFLQNNPAGLSSFDVHVLG
jgi:hypothetical protein